MGYSTSGVGIVKIVIGIEVEVIIVATKPRGSTSLFTIHVHYPFSALRIKSELYAHKSELWPARTNINSD